MACVVYYVTPNNGNQSCPIEQECHTLSYYMNNITLPSNLTLLFINGEHIIKTNEGLQIEGLNNVIFLGQGQWVHGFHWSVMQSSVIIKCISNITTAINVSVTSVVQIDGLTINNCHRGIFIASCVNVQLNNLSIQNSSHIGLVIENTTIVTINSCSFSHNGVNVNLISVKTITISYSNFTFGYLYNNKESTGLFILNEDTLSHESRRIEIITCLISLNNGGGGFIHSNVTGNQVVIIQNTIFSNNNGNMSIGGLRVWISTIKGHSEIVISQVIFSYNIAVRKTKSFIVGGADFTIFSGSHSTVIIQNTTFRNNIAIDKPKTGHLFVTIKANGHTKTNVSQVIFSATETNYLNDIGVVFYIDSGSSCTFNLQNTTFTENNLLLHLERAHKLQAQIKDANFSSSIGTTAGASIYMVSDCFSVEKSLHIQNTAFYNQTGRALLIEGNAKIELTNVIIANTFSKANSQPNQYLGALKLLCLDPRQTATLSNVHVVNNDMSGLWIKGCLVFFKDKSSVIAENKSPGNGGGIYADDNTCLSSSVGVHFINNTAIQYGGAIYFTTNVRTIYISTVSYCNLCSFSVFNVTFSQNYARLAGNDIFGGYYFNPNGLYIPNFIDVVTCNSDYFKDPDFQFCFPKHQLSLSISSAAIGACLCTNDTYVDCTRRVYQKELYPGQTIKLSLATVGICGVISPSQLLTHSTGIDVTSNEVDQVTNTYCKNFTYQLKVRLVPTEGNITIQTSGSLQLKESNLTIIIKMLPCPLGLELNKLSGICECSDIINAVKPQCDMSQMPYPIKRSGNNWISYNKEHNCIIALADCPFDYCNTSLILFNLNNSDFQCTHNRSGTLCGQCQSGLSLMLGSNKCGVCTNDYLALIAVFVVAGLCLCVLLLTLNLTVSVGSINGLLFYANMVKLNRSVLFSSGQIPVLSQFIAWLNLDLGIETCFFNGLDGYWKTWLQFAFSLSLITGLIICCRYSGKLSRLCGNNVVPVLSTLILMAHSKLLITIKNALMLSRVQCEHTVWNVWSVDGNIKYLHDKHIPLFLVSLIFLFFGFVYTGLILSSQWLQRYTGKYCRSSIDPFIVLKPFIDAYNGPYKDKSRFWTGLLLMMRLFVTSLFAVTTGIVPQVNNYVITIIVIILLPASRGIYKVKINSALEMFFLFNLGFISLLNTISNDKTFTYWVDLVSIGLSLIVFTGIVLAYTYMYIKRKCAIKMNVFKQMKQTNVDEPLLKERSSFSSESQAEKYSPAHTVLKRESLIFELELPGYHHDM